MISSAKFWHKVIKFTIEFVCFMVSWVLKVYSTRRRDPISSEVRFGFNIDLLKVDL